MFPEIQTSIAKGECLLENNLNFPDECPRPLVKDMFSAQRRTAKVINFSIAYGRTIYGFCNEFVNIFINLLDIFLLFTLIIIYNQNCGIDEVKKYIKKWYADREEVQNWQKEVKKIAIKEGYTKTLLGRYRNLKKQLKGKSFTHALRASINTPIQGGAADIVIASMIKLYLNERLRELGYKIILQIHDEIILV